MIIFRFKFPYPLQWGAPTFDAGHTFAMMAAVLVSLIEVYLCITYTKWLMTRHPSFEIRVFVRATCVPLSENMRMIIYGNRITTHDIFHKDLKFITMSTKYL